jgi:hypothetical protein
VTNGNRVVNPPEPQEAAREWFRLVLAEQEMSAAWSLIDPHLRESLIESARVARRGPVPPPPRSWVTDQHEWPEILVTVHEQLRYKWAGVSSVEEWFATPVPAYSDLPAEIRVVMFSDQREAGGPMMIVPIVMRMVDGRWVVFALPDPTWIETP